MTASTARGLASCAARQISSAASGRRRCGRSSVSRPSRCGSLPTATTTPSAAAAAADVVVVAVGNDPHLLGRETEDRPHLRLPEESVELWRAAREANPRAVLALVSSYPYVLGSAASDAAAVVWSSHGGQELGHGLVDVLTGDREPTGRLAQTWVADEAHAGDLLAYAIIAAGSTYWYARHEPLYAFGHGLSYTRVEYTAIELSSPVLDVPTTTAPDDHSGADGP